tara:strand:+ start:591 stop:899 length:309 start_codon:yes stop_codon:yes gene_type:complete
MKKAHLHLIKWGLAKGYTISVWIEGEHEYSGTGYKAAKDASEAGDIGNIDFLDTDTYKRIASFDYVHEFVQNPDEIIYDYGINKISEAWAADYDQHCEESKP